MIFLNLLPEEQKKEIEYEKTNITLISAFIIVFLVLVGLISSLFLAKSTLNKNLESLNNQKESYEKLFSAKDNKEIEETISSLNKLSTTVIQINNLQIHPSYLISEIARITPNKIKYTSLTIDKEKLLLGLSGTAVSRDDLLNLTKSLEDSNLFSEVKAPLSNITSPENIDFTIETKISITTLEIK